MDQEMAAFEGARTKWHKAGAIAFIRVIYGITISYMGDVALTHILSAGVPLEERVTRLTMVDSYFSEAA